MKLNPTLGLAALAVLPYLPALAQPFFADDYIHLERATAAAAHPALLGRAWVLRAEDAAAWWAPPDLALRYFRPLSSASFVADRAVWGRSALGFHLTSLLLHAATTLVVLAVFRRLLPPGPGPWLGAALFALHPAHAEAVLWVSARADLLCALFYLAAFWFYLRTRQSGGSPGAAGVAAAACLVSSLAAKEMAVTFPLVALFEALAFPRGQSLRRRLAAPAMAAVIVGAYLALRASVVGPLGLPPRPFATPPTDPGFARHLAFVLFQYTADLVVFVPADPVVTGPFWARHPAATALVALAVGGVLLATVRAVGDRRRRVLIMGLGLAGITLLPVLPLTVGEHFLYLPSVGYCLLVGAQSLARSEDHGRSRRPLFALGAVVAAVALVRTLAFGGIARATRQTIDDALAAWDAAPRARTLLVVDVPGPAALGFAHALRLERPGRPVDVEILSISPQALPGGAPVRSEIDGLDTGRIMIRRPEGFLGSYVERAFAGERPPFVPGESVVRGRVVVTVRDVREGRPQSLEVSRTGAPDEPALLLRGEGYRLRAQAWPAR